MKRSFLNFAENQQKVVDFSTGKLKREELLSLKEKKFSWYLF